MSEMVDRVASEIAAHIALHPGARWEDVARAAMRAMVLPTGKMIDAGAERDGRNTAITVWVDMINEALKDSPPPSPPQP